jgi:hsp70-interacting protein
MDKGLNDLLKWSIENTKSDGSDAPASTEAQQAPMRTPNAEALAALMGGPSDADLMLAAMNNIMSPDPEITLESKLIAFDNLEQLIESLDNANLLSKLALWTPLLELLGHDEPQLRLMAAWCIGTAVQNNEPSQERLVAMGGVERLTAVALGERLSMKKQSGEGDVVAENGNAGEKEQKDVRRKAVYALSSACRNYQPAMDVLSSELGKREGRPPGAGKVQADDMDAVDAIILDLREKALSA